MILMFYLCRIGNEVDFQRFMVLVSFTTTADLSVVHSKCQKYEDALFCSGSVSSDKVHSDIKALHIVNPTMEVLNFNYFSNLCPNLKELYITGTNYSKLKEIEIPLTPFNLTVLQLSSLHIETIGNNFTAQFPYLQVLNLTGNNISYFSRINSNVPKEIYLHGNTWNCSGNMEWVLELNKTIFRDLDEWRCFKMPHKNKPVLAIAEFKLETRKSCTPNCSCNLLKCITDMETDTLEPIIEVNCSYRGFEGLPNTFPAKTKILHMEGNFVTDLSPLKQNLIYRDLLDIYLDDNLVSDIITLEGSYWLTHFRVFSLRNNKLTELPAYAIDNALQHNNNMPNAVRLILGGNPWRCDCIFAPRFKELLQKYTPQISDLSDIKCAKDSENPSVAIIDLSRASVCHSPSEYTIQESLELLNGILACLTFLVLGKLAYDYYHFKKTGRLPWIVTKIP